MPVQGSSVVRLPTRRAMRPILAICVRFGIALAVVLVTWLLVVIERGGYTDAHDGHVSVSDALYYTTVTLTTTGYGDITPVTTSARMVNALVITPMRLLFVVLLIGTTIQALTVRSREEYRLARWRSRVNNHVVVLGYGTKGRNAVRELMLKDGVGTPIVVIDSDPAAVRAATAAGHTAVHGSATREELLTQAMVDRARLVIVALARDDAAILATLTVRRVAPEVRIIAAAREERNAGLLRQGGASSVIVSSETTGRLLGLAAGSPATVRVVEDLLSFGEGIDLVERPVRAGEVGGGVAEVAEPVLAVLRDGGLLRYSDPAIGALRPADRLIFAAAQA